MSMNDGQQSGDGGRVRKNTLERFNDEMSVLDRPLEGDVEYYDEEPPKRWPRVGAIAAALFVVSGGGFLVLSRIMGGGAPAIQMVAAANVAPAPVAAAAPAVAPMPVAAAPAEVETEVEPELDAVPGDAPPVAAAVAPSHWGKVGKSTGRAKHARATKATRRHRKHR